MKIGVDSRINYFEHAVNDRVWFLPYTIVMASILDKTAFFECYESMNWDQGTGDERWANSEALWKALRSNTIQEVGERETDYVRVTSGHLYE